MCVLSFSVVSSICQQKHSLKYWMMLKVIFVFHPSRQSLTKITQKCWSSEQHLDNDYKLNDSFLLILARFANAGFLVSKDKYYLHSIKNINSSICHIISHSPLPFYDILFFSSYLECYLKVNKETYSYFLFQPVLN